MVAAIGTDQGRAREDLDNGFRLSYVNRPTLDTNHRDSLARFDGVSVFTDVRSRAISRGLLAQP